MVFYFQYIYMLKGNLMQDIYNYYSKVLLYHLNYADYLLDRYPPIMELIIYYSFSCN